MKTDESTIKHLISQICVIDGASDIIDVEKNFRKQIRYSSIPKYENQICERLEGWWYKKAIEALCSDTPIFVTQSQVRSFIVSVSQEYAECPYQPGKLTAFAAVKFTVKGADNDMAVFRVEKNKGYTVMSNHHLRNKALSLKAKGLLSQKSLFRVVENGEFLNRLRNGHLEKSAATGLFRPSRSPKTAKTPRKVHLRLRFQNLGKPRTAGLCGRAAGACDCGPLSCAFIERPSPLRKPSCKVRLFAQNRSRKYRQKVAVATLLQTALHRVFQLLAQMAHVCFRSRKRVHARLSEKNRTQGHTRRNRSLPSPGHSTVLSCQRNRHRKNSRRKRMHAYGVCPLPPASRPRWAA